MTHTIILASASPFRKAMLDKAGIAVTAEPARIDERAVEAAIEGSGVSPGDVATILAEAKAIEVSQRFPGAWVIGSDQTLSIEGEILHKAEDMEEGRRRLLRLSGRTHQLDSAVVLARDGQAVWRHVARADMTMRALTPEEIGRYLARAGSVVLKSVGVYQIEGLGIRLFDKVDGDHFTIVGLPLLPLIAALRARDVLDD